MTMLRFRCDPDFNFEEIAATIGFQIESRNREENSKVQPYKHYAYCFSECEFDDLAGQIEDAIIFLEKYKKDLEELLSHKTVESSLGFAIWLRIGNQIVAQSDIFPAQLLKLAGDLNLDIEFSIYPKEDRFLLEGLGEKELRRKIVRSLQKLSKKLFKENNLARRSRV